MINKKIVLLFSIVAMFFIISSVSAENFDDGIYPTELTPTNQRTPQIHTLWDDTFYSIEHVEYENISGEKNCCYKNQTKNDSKSNPEINFTIANRTLDGNATLVINGNPNITGNLIFSFLANESFKLSNGSYTYHFNSLEKGSYNFKTYLRGDETYSNANYDITFTIPSFLSKLTSNSENITMYYHNGSRLETNLLDDLGRPLVNKTIKYRVNGVTYTRITDDKGNTTFNLKLSPGNYTIETAFEGLSAISGNTTNVSLTVLPTLTGRDIEKIYKNNTQYYVTAVDGNGNPLANRNLTFNINGVFYNRSTNENGTAGLNINLISGNYTVTVENTKDSYKISNKITVLSTIISNDLVKIYKNDSQFVVSVTDDKGEIKTSGSVEFNINGVIYKRYVNSTGQVKLNINLAPGKYIITTLNNNDSSKISNTIEVTPYLYTQDLVKYYRNASKFEAKLVDSSYNPVAGEKITFTINGNQYQRTTDNNGVAGLAINLQPGEYEIISSNAQYRAVNRVKILPTLILPANNTDKAQFFSIDKIYVQSDGYAASVHDKNKYPVTVLDSNGKPYPNQNVTFKMDGNSYHVTSDSDGIARFSNIEVDGKFHEVTATYNGYSQSQLVRMLG